MTYFNQDSHIEQTIQDEYDGHLKDTVEYLKQWISRQKHLPDTISDQLLYQFAAATKCNTDKACKKLDAYYTVRNLIPEFYSSRDPSEEDIVKSCRCLALGFLPGVTYDGSKVMIFSLLNTNPSEFELVHALRRCYMYMDLKLMKSDLKPGQGIYFLSDAAGATIGHMMKFSPSILRKNVFCMQGVYPVRMKGKIFVNMNEVVTMSINTILKPLFRPKLRKRFYVFGSNKEELYKLIPKDNLPPELGGCGPTYAELSARAQEELIIAKSWMLTEGSEKTNENRRDGKCPISAPGCCVM